MAFYPGQRVVCVDDGPAWDGLPPGVVRGRVYVVSDIIRQWCGVGLLLEGLTPRDHHKGFLAKRFRPLDEKRLDVFRAMLAPKPKQKTRENSNA